MSRLFSAQSSPLAGAWWAHHVPSPGILTPHAAQRLIALPPEAILHLANLPSGDAWRPATVMLRLIERRERITDHWAKV